MYIYYYRINKVRTKEEDEKERTNIGIYMCVGNFASNPHATTTAAATRPPRKTVLHSTPKNAY
jgi:hypothetical protein